jgi:hypothetical protein
MEKRQKEMRRARVLETDLLKISKYYLTENMSNENDETNKIDLGLNEERE